MPLRDQHGRDAWIHEELLGEKFGDIPKRPAKGYRPVTDEEMCRALGIPAPVEPTPSQNPDANPHPDHDDQPADDPAADPDDDE